MPAIIDRVYASKGGAGVAVSLGGVHEDGSGGASGTGANINNDASGDTLSGFEDLLGSAFNDTLSGDGGGSSLLGAGGDVLIHATKNRNIQLIREYYQ